jgi:virginiamycin B lyase
MLSTRRLAVALVLGAALLPLLLWSAPAGAEVRLTPLPPSLISELPVNFEVSDMAIGPEGEVWGTPFYGGPIERASPMGVLTGRFTLPEGPEPDEPTVARPTGIMRGDDGAIWFDAGYNSDEEGLIGRITPAGKVTMFQSGLPKVQIGAPVLGADGDIWFTASDFGSVPSRGYICRLNPDGEMKTFPVPTGPGQRNEPESSSPGAMVLGSDGALWFSDDGRNSEEKWMVGRVSTSGTISEFPLPDGGEFGGMALASDGSVWFETFSHSIDRVAPSGEVTSFPIPELGSSLAEGLTLGPDGDLWFLFGTNALGRVTVDGEVRLYTGIPEPGGFASIVLGPEGELWYPAQGASIARITVPRAPTSTSAPAIAGKPVAGQQLSADGGGWAGESSELSYQWETCAADGGICSPLPGATGSNLLIGPGEVGASLRVQVTATNIAGTATATSPPTAAITAAPVVPEVEVVPQVGATMGLKVGWGVSFTILESMRLNGVPASSEIELRCEGRGCPFKTRTVDVSADGTLSRCARGRCGVSGRHEVFDLSRLWRKHKLRVGTRVTILVLRRGWIGRAFHIRVRANRRPEVKIGCLVADSATKPEQC